MDARAFFNDVRRASGDIEDYGRAIQTLKDELPPVSSGGVNRGGAGESDPVLGAVVTREKLLGEYRARRDEALEIVGEGLIFIAALRMVFCKKADVLEFYYVDRMTMRAVADEMHIAIGTVVAWRDELLAFADANPIAYILGLRFVEKPQDVVL